MKIIQIYAPTSTHSDEEMEAFYDDVSRAMNENRTHYLYLVGDFNAKLGKKADEAEYVVGRYGTGDRNERGDMLLDYLHQKNLFAANTFFRRKRQNMWTWASADGVTKNEIDYIMTPRIATVLNITTLNSFYIGSDHRMVRAKIRVNLRAERSRMTKKPLTRVGDMTDEQLTSYSDAMTRELSSIDIRILDIEDLNQIVVTNIKNHLETNCRNPVQKTSKISEHTNILIEERRQMLKEGKRDTIDFRVLNRSTNKEIRNDIRAFNARLVEQTIEENRGMKALGRKLSDPRKDIQIVR